MLLITQGYGASGTPSLALLQGYTSGEAAVAGGGGQIAAAGIYRAGAVQGQTHAAGSQVGQVFVAGDEQGGMFP